jgi:hypothetical protein
MADRDRKFIVQSSNINAENRVLISTMRLYLIISVSLFISISSYSQDANWATLGIVSTTTSFDPDFGIETKKVKVSSAIKALQGKQITLEGYFIPLNGKLAQNHFMISKFNEKMCFFCGKAGPETAAQVFLSDNKKQAYSEEKIKVVGILRINESDPSGLLYTIEQAKVIN